MNEIERAEQWLRRQTPNKGFETPLTNVIISDLLEYIKRLGEPETLTLDGLIGLEGKPVWWTSGDPPYKNGCGWVIVDLNNLPGKWYDYGKTWLAYDREPSETRDEH